MTLEQVCLQILNDEKIKDIQFYEEKGVLVEIEITYKNGEITWMYLKHGEWFY